MPVDVDALEKLLVETKYCAVESVFLLDGFRNGFDIGYRGSLHIQQRSPNLKIRVGSHLILWNKIMKEVKNLRYAGPYEEIPYEYYIQSPVGLVPKDNGKDTRLIFHLSYPRKGVSLNSETPRELTTVKYCDVTDAVKLCLQAGRGCKISKSDMKSAFRNLGVKKHQWCLLILMAKSPIDQKTYFFVDKCMPFGAAISYSNFQRFSDAIAHIS